MASSPSNGNSEEGTRVDLGEDLIATPRIPAVEPKHQAPPRPLSVREELDSVRILLNEGLLEDARRTLFRVLRLDPANSLARRFLDEIRDLEVQALLTPRTQTRATLTKVEKQKPTEPAAVVSRLDSDWNLGIGSDPEEKAQCEAWVSQFLSRDTEARELQDWASSLILMDQPDLAAQILEKRIRPGSETASRALLAQTYLLAARPQEARMVCESALRDPGVVAGLRDELTYLLARALEMLQHPREAASLYQVLGAYRDSKLRLSELKD